VFGTLVLRSLGCSELWLYGTLASFGTWVFGFLGLLYPWILGFCQPLGSSDSFRMFAAGRMVLRLFLGSHGTLVAVSAPLMMPLCDSDIPMNVPFTFRNKQPLPPEPHTLIAAIQTQVSLQHQLLAAQATLARQDELISRVWAALPQGAGMHLASLTAPPAVAQAPMILGGAQPEGYVYIGTNQGLIKIF
jgi:hypothetical protein